MIQKSSSCLRKYYRDEPITKGTGVIVDFTRNGFNKLFKFIERITAQINSNGRKDV